MEPQAFIFPGYMAPVVRRAEDGDLELVKLSWGFVLLRDGSAPKRVTNVRDDQILRSKFWRGSFEERRCLVLATSFCEPNGDAKPASWHWFALKGDDPRPAFAFPGIWRRYNGPIRKNGGRSSWTSMRSSPPRLPAGGHDQPRAHVRAPQQA